MGSLEEVFVRKDIELIVQNQPVVEREVFFTWKLNKSGDMTVKSAYWLASSLKAKEKNTEAFREPSTNLLKEKVWQVKTVPKIRVFLWKSLSAALPTADLISARGMKVDSRCQTCGEEPESINHMLFTCPFARLVWASSSIPYPNGGFDEGSIFTNVNFLLNLSGSERITEEDKRAWP